MSLHINPNNQSSSYEEIVACNLCDCENLKYPRYQLQLHRVFMHLDVHRETWPHPKKL